MVHYSHTVPGRFLSRGAWLEIAEATKVYKCALDELSVDPIAGLLANGVVYESQRVLNPLIGRDIVLDYLKGKFAAVAKSDVVHTLHTGVVDLPRGSAWPCLIIELETERQGLIALTLEEQRQISRVDLLSVAPRPEEARVADLTDPAGHVREAY